ncbi:hypothetical protein PTKIN_Ptkin15bG0150700 [Pterospermum kingtungense]
MASSPHENVVSTLQHWTHFQINQESDGTSYQDFHVITNEDDGRLCRECKVQLCSFERLYYYDICHDCLGLCLYIYIFGLTHRLKAYSFYHLNSTEKTEPKPPREPALIKVAQLRPGTNGVRLIVKVVRRVDSASSTLAEWLVADETAAIIFTAEGNQDLTLMREGATLIFLNARVLSLSNGSMRLTVLDNHRDIEAAPQPAGIEMAAELPREPALIKVAQLRPKEKGLSLIVKVVKRVQRVWSRVAEWLVADDTAGIILLLKAN